MSISTATLINSKQDINIGVQSNDGTGDSIREAFRKTKENFDLLFDWANGNEGGFSFFNLNDAPDKGFQSERIMVAGTTATETLELLTPVGIGGIEIKFNWTGSEIIVNNTQSSLVKDPNPTLAANLNGTNTGTIGSTGTFRAINFGDPIGDQELVTRRFLYDNFLQRDGILTTGTAETSVTTIGGSILRENISIIPSNSTATSNINSLTYVLVYDSTGSTSTVSLATQATSSTQITRKDYVDTKISLQGVDTIDPATGEVNSGFGKMTGPLILSRNPQTSDDTDFNGLIAATKNYVDSNSFYSDNNIFITQNGRDYQPEVPPVRRGRAPAYAFRTINKAAQYAERLINTSRIEVGDYARLITYGNGKPATVIDIVDDYYGNNLARLRLNVGSYGSDQIGAAAIGEFTIFPGQYIQGVDSGAIALIENITKAENNGDPEIYTLLYVDYGDDFDTKIRKINTPSLPSNVIRFRFVDEPQQLVPIPSFWLGYKFYIDGGTIGTIVNIDADIDDRGVYHNFFDVEYELGAPTTEREYSETEWHVYSGDFIEGETVVYNTNVSSLQITLVIESGEYYEQYPIKLSNNVSIRGDEFRRVIVRPAPGPSASKWSNTYFRRDAQTDGLQTSAIDYTTDYAYGGTLANATAIPSGSNGVITISISVGSFPTDVVGYMFVANGGQGIITDATAGGFTVDLGTEMLNASEIPYGEWHIYKPILFGYHYLRDPLRPINLLTTVNNPGGLNISAALMTATVTRSTLQDQVIEFIDTTFGSTGTYTYDHVKCYRDTGLIVDSVAQDLLFGGSSQTTFAGIQYWSQTGYTGLIEGELTTTTNTINYIKSIAQKVIRNDVTGVRYQSTVSQVVSTSTATVAEVSIIGTDFDVVTNILTNGTNGTTDTIVPNNLTASTTASVLTAYNLLQSNKTYLQAEAVAYVLDNTTDYVFDNAKCYRDIGYIIDSVSFDLLYSGNKQAVQSGVYYYSYSTSTTSVIEGQSIPTRAAYTYIRNILPSVITGQALSTTYQSTVTQILSTGTIGTSLDAYTAQKKIDTITHIISAGPIGADVPTPITNTRSSNTGTINSANLLDLNREFLQAETVAYVNSQIGAFAYNKTKCRRDVGLIIDSIARDLVYGGSERTIYAGESYRNVAVVQQFETLQTAAAVAHLGTLLPAVIADAAVSEPTAPAVVADLIQALSRIIANDAEYNPPKNNDQLDVFLMNDANVIRYISCQNHGGFMQVLDPAGQIKNKSPYTQTASSFSQSIAKHAFRGGMLVDGFSGNVMCTPVEWDPINSPLDLRVTGLIRRPQVPTFFMNKGVRYEVDFFADFQPAGDPDEYNVQRYSATLKLNPLTPGGIRDAVSVTNTAQGFQQRSGTIPIVMEQPTGIGGLAARGYAILDGSGGISGIKIDFPGTGYLSTPFISVGGAVLNNLTILAGSVVSASIVGGGYGYDVGCEISIVPYGIIGGVAAQGVVTEVDNNDGSGNGVITKISITYGGANWSNSVNYRVVFGNMEITVPDPIAGFLDTTPTEVELITAGNRSMLANDFTQVNDLGYGIFVTNGGFMENVSMFTYYCYRSYYSLNGSQVRTTTGSSCYGEYGLVADGSDPTEVPLALSNVFPMVQIAEAFVNNPLFPAQAGQSYIYVRINPTIGGYPPLNGSMIEINHKGIRRQYSIGSASPALSSQNEEMPGIYQLFFNTGNISLGTQATGLLSDVDNGDPVIIRASTLVKVTGFNPVSIARPSTSLTWDDDPTYVYHITGFSTVQPDGSVFAYTQEDYNYIVFQVVNQGIIHPTLVSGGTGYVATETSVRIYTTELFGGYSHNVNGTQGLGTIGIQTLALDDVSNVYVGQSVSTGTYILPDTYVTWVNTTTNQVCISNPTVGAIPDGTSLTFDAVLPSAHVTISSGTISSIVVDEGGAGWRSPSTVIQIVNTGSGIGAAVSSPVKIAGVPGSDVIKITTLDLTSQNRILSGLTETPPRYYQFAFGDEIYNIIDYKTPSSRGSSFEVSVDTVGTGTVYSAVAITEPGTGYSTNQTLTILGTQLGGNSPENDLIITVTLVNSSGGILDIDFSGTSGVFAGNYLDVSPPDDGQVSAEITLDRPLVEAVSKGTILRAGISINSPGSLTTKISILRATAHDFVDIGTGGYATTRIPNDLYGPPIQKPQYTHEVIQANRGRVYYVSSDQDGNFRVGNALTVNQAQGSVTISVPLDLSNLSSLSLRRDLGPPINEFSVDSTMVTEADYKVPTEQAVANYINRRLGLDRNGNIYPGSPLGPQFLSLDGQLAMKADLDLGYTNRIINLQTPEAVTDASTKGYSDTKIANAGTAATDVNGITLKPEWGNMTGSLQLFNDPDVKYATVATTATVGSTSIVFDSLTTNEYQPGDFFQARVLVAGVPTGTIVNAVFQDGITIALGDPNSDANVLITQTIPAGTQVLFDSVKQAASKRYVDKTKQFSKLVDVSLTSTADVDLVMFNNVVLPVNTTTNPPLYESTRQVVNVANDNGTILNTPIARSGGSDVTIERPTSHGIRIKLVGGQGSYNPVTDYHVNDDAQVAQSKLFLTTATTRASALVGTQREIQATLGSASFNSRMFWIDRGWVSLTTATSTANGIFPREMTWVPTGGGLLGSTTVAGPTSSTYVTSASIQTWLQNISSNWSFSSDLLSNGDLKHDLGASGTRWANLFANTGTFSQGVNLNSLAKIATDQAGASIFTTTVTTLEIGKQATSVSIGTGSGTMTLANTTIVGTQSTLNLFNTVATTVNFASSATTLTVGSSTAATLTLRPGTTVGANATQNLYNTVATTINFAGAATSLNLGATSGTITIGNPTVVGSQATQNLYNTVATTMNFAGAATTVNIGSTTGITTVNHGLTVSGVSTVTSLYATTALYDNNNRVITNVDAATSGNGISVSTETQTGPNVSFTISSNATSSNTASTIVYRDASGNFAASVITGNITNTAAADTTQDLVSGVMATNDQFRLRIGGASNAGYVEIATADDGTEPIYVRQYSGAFATLAHEAVLLDASGNTVLNDAYVDNLRSNGGTSYVYGTWQLGAGSTFQATYADLAEYYTADQVYETGTVLVFGGDKEVTTTNIHSDQRVAGVVSTNAAYIMNADCVGTRACIALQGRVPVKVIGTVKKGDLLTTADRPGYATKAVDPKVGTIVGKALVNKDTIEPGIIEVAIGRN